MKYLKRYNIYERSINESVSLDIIENVKDILLELNDIGFQSRVDGVSKSFLNSPNKDTLRISIYKYDLLNSEFGDSGYMRYKVSDVKDIILRLNSYLSEVGYPLYSLYIDIRGYQVISNTLYDKKGSTKIGIDDLDEMSDYIIIDTTLEFCKD